MGLLVSMRAMCTRLRPSRAIVYVQTHFLEALLSLKLYGSIKRMRQYGIIRNRPMRRARTSGSRMLTQMSSGVCSSVHLLVNQA